MFLTKKSVLSFVIIACFCSSGLAQSTTSQRLDSLFDMLNATRKSMCTIEVLKNDQVLYSKIIGFRDSTAKGTVVSDAHTKYRVASITKLFTAVIILQMIEEGKLSYQTKLSEFYPDFSYAGKVSIEQMLNHHSGLPRYASSTELGKLMALKTKEEVVKLAAKQPYFAQDTLTGQYSNLNYILLGFIIEKLSATTFNEQLQKRIVSKLGLTDTYNQPDYINADKNEAHSFRMKKQLWVEDFEDHYLFTDASGQIMSTATDLNKFITGLFNGRLLTAESLRKMTTIHDKYGMGIMNAPFYEKKGFGHTGRIDGFVSSVSFFPEEHLAISICINGQIYPMNDILVGVLNIIYNKPYEIPSLKTVVLKDEELAKFEGKYTCKELPMSAVIKKKGSQLQLQIKRKGSLFKQVMLLNAIGATRFIYNSQGIIIDFSLGSDRSVSLFNMKISGAKLNFTKL